MWSSVSVTGSPRILLVDGTQNLQGWEHAFSDRLYGSLQRSELQLHGNGPVRVRHATELTACLSEQSTAGVSPAELRGRDVRGTAIAFNCLILFAHGESEQMRLSTFWNSLRLQPPFPPFLFAVCSCQSFDPQVSDEVLKSTPAVTPLAIAPLSTMLPREAGLFYLKFFTELKLHSAESISGKMVWFSFSKARELLRRRRYSARFGVRC